MTTNTVKRKSADQLVLKLKPGTGKIVSRIIQKPADQNDPNPLVAALTQLNAVEEVPINHFTQQRMTQFEKNCELTRKSRAFYGNKQ